MSDPFGLGVSTQRGGGGGSSALDSYLQTATSSSFDVAQIAKINLALNPYLANDPGALMSLSQGGGVSTQFVDTMAQMGGIQTADRLRQTLEGMSVGAQRAAWASLRPDQQAALGSMKYRPPSDGGGFLGDIGGFVGGAANMVGDVLGPALGAVGSVAGPVVGETLDALTWLGDRTAHLYRTIRTMDSEAQWRALAFGLGAVALAPLTGGASLLGLGGALGTAGFIGGMGLAGATLGAVSYSPTAWWGAFKSSYHGERTFTRNAQSRAQQLLGNDELLSSVARDIAWSADISGVYDLAEHIAGNRGLENSTILNTLAEVAGGMAEPGTPQHQQIYASLLELAGNADFSAAVKELHEGKISPGRDVARWLGLQSGDRFYNVVSGSTDALWQIAMDPTLALGAARRASKLWRYGIDLSDDATAALTAAVRAKPEVRRAFEVVAESVSKRDFQMLERQLPEATGLYADLVQHTNQEHIDFTKFGVDELIDWFDNQDKLKGLMRGDMTVRGESRMILSTIGRGRASWNLIKSRGRDLIEGLDDANLETTVRKWAEKNGIAAEMETRLPDELYDRASNAYRATEDHAANRRATNTAYAVGRLFGEFVPPARQLGAMAVSLTTKLPPGTSVRLTGRESANEIKQLVDMGRVLGMDSSTRRYWTDFILAQESRGLRLNASAAVMDAFLHVGGLHALPDGEILAQRWINKWRQSYGFDDVVDVDGVARRTGWLPQYHDAVEIVVPNLVEMRQAMRRGHVLQNVLRVTDHPLYAQKFMGLWKPAVLMRVGFIARAAGEELLSLLARMSVRDMGQIKAGVWLTQRKVARGAMYKAKTDAGTIFTEIEQEALKRYDAPGFRNVMRLAGGRDFDQVAMRIKDATDGGRIDRVWAERWANFLERALQPGTGLLDITLPRVEDATSRWSAGARAMMHNLVEGNSRTWRSMIINGVDPDVAAATRLWASDPAVSTAMMREVSAQSASVFSAERPGGDNPVLKELVPDPKRPGEFIEKEMILVRRERRMLDRNDAHFNATHHRRQAEPLLDEVIREPLAEVTPRYLDPELGLDATEVNQVLNQIDAVIQDPDLSINARRLIHEALTTTNQRTWRATIASIRESDPDLADALAIVLARNHGRLDLVDIERAYERLYEQADIIDAAAPNGTTVTRRHMRTLRSLRSLHDVRAFTDTMTVAQRRWLETMVDHRLQVGPTELLEDFDSFMREAGEAIRRRMLDPDNAIYLKGSVRQHQVREMPLAEPVSDNQIRMFAPANDRRVFAQLRNAYADLRPEEAAEHLLDQWRQINRQLRFGGDELADSVPEELVREVFRKIFSLSDRQFQRARHVSIYGSHPLPFTVIGVNDPRLARALGDFFDITTGHAAASSIAQIDVDDAARLMKIGPSDGATALHLTDVGGQRVWALDPAVLGNRAEIIPDSMPLNKDVTGTWQVGVTWEQAVDSQVEFILDEIMRKWGRRTSAAVRVGEGATLERILPDRTVEAVQGGTVLREAETLYDLEGNPVLFGDGKWFDMIGEANSTSITWESVGPLLQDTIDDLAGRAKWAAYRKPGAKVGEGDMVRTYRAEPGHVTDIGNADLPSIVEGEMTRTRHLNLWERFVKFGFDGVISPAIDAIVRKPMAMHYFVNAYIDNSKRLKWMLDKQLFTQADELMEALRGSLIYNVTDASSIRMARAAAKEFGDPEITNAMQARAYLASRADPRIQEEIDTLKAAIHFGSGRDFETMRDVRDSLEDTLRWGALRDDPTAERFLDRVEELRDYGAGSDAFDFGSLRPEELKGIAAALADEGFTHGLETLKLAGNNLRHTRNTIRDLSIERAIGNIMPFLDSHELRSQFGEWAKGLMPFWYAEENFIKRIARSVNLAPEAIRKAQLAYMGIKSAGFIRTDESGQDWFVYPGSGVLSDVLEDLSELTGKRSDIPGFGLIFQARTDRLLPGYSADVGKPAFSPFVTIAADQLSGIFPELRPIQTAVVGEQSVNRGWLDQIMPSTIRNVVSAMSADETSTRYAAAMMSAIQMMAANGQIPDNATPAELEDFWRTVKNHARITLIAQAAVGFITPGAPQGVLTGESAYSWGNLTGTGVEDPAEFFGTEYRQLVSQLGVDEGTLEFLARNKNAHPMSFVNPLAFTVGRSERPSGAPLPVSKQLVDAYDANKEWYDQYPMAGPWVLPEPADADQFNQAAYTYQLANELRERRTPEEFYTEVLYKEGGIDYFRAQEEYQAKRDSLTTSEERAELDSRWQLWANTYKTTHPVFAERLTSPEARNRRAAIISQLRTVVADPNMPPSPHADAVREFVTAFNDYDGRRQLMGLDRSQAGRAKLEGLKTAWAQWATMFVMNHPSTESLWMSVLQPNSEL